MATTRAYQVGVKNWDRFSRTIFADTPGRAKSSYYRDIRESYPDLPFTALTCRSLGKIQVPLTRQEIAQLEADAFNAKHPIGTMLHYWSGIKEGLPTGTAPISHKATVMSDHVSVWMKGVRSCHSISHVERADVLPSITLRTKLTGNHRLIVVEEHFDQRTGERYLVDETGNRWQAPEHTCSPQPQK